MVLLAQLSVEQGEFAGVNPGQFHRQGKESPEVVQGCGQIGHGQHGRHGRSNRSGRAQGQGEEQGGHMVLEPTQPRQICRADLDHLDPEVQDLPSDDPPGEAVGNRVGGGLGHQDDRQDRRPGMSHRQSRGVPEHPGELDLPGFGPVFDQKDHRLGAIGPGGQQSHI